MAVSIVNVTVMTVRVLMLIASVVGLFAIGVYEQTAPLHASLYGQEEDCVRPPLLLSQLDFNDKNALLDIEKTLHGSRSAPWLWKLTRDAVFAALEMYHTRIQNSCTLYLLSGSLCGLVPRQVCGIMVIRIRNLEELSIVYSYTLTTCLLQLSL